jgi:hypothetical protein
VICYNLNLLDQPDDHHPGDDHLDDDHPIDADESESQYEKRKALPPPCRQKSDYHDGDGEAFDCNQGSDDNHKKATQK